MKCFLCEEESMEGLDSCERHAGKGFTRALKGDEE